MTTPYQRNGASHPSHSLVNGMVPNYTDGDGADGDEDGGDMGVVVMGVMWEGGRRCWWSWKGIGKVMRRIKKKKIFLHFCMSTILHVCISTYIYIFIYTHLHMSISRATDF